MATKQDPKMNAIIECIAQGQLRKAMNKVNTQIQMTDGLKFHCLKALIFQKLKKPNECLEIIKKVRAQAIEEPESLEILILIYKNMKRMDLITEIYQETYDKLPVEDRGRNLYQALTNEFKFGEQAKLSLRLHKAYDNEEFAEWAAFSMLVLAETDPRQYGMVEIADLLFQKIKRKEGFKYSPSFFKLDVAIQEKLKLYSEVIHLLNQHTEIIADYIERSVLIAKFYRYRAEYVHSLNLYHSMLSVNLTENTSRDLWNVTLDYIDCIFEILKQCTEGSTRFNPQGPVDTNNYAIKAVDSGGKTALWKPFTGSESVLGLLTAAISNIKYTRDSVNGRNSIVDLIKRQSYLAEMEFKRRLIYWNFNQGSEEYKDENETGGIFMNLIMKYLTIYYEVSTTPDEIIPFLYMVNVTQLIAFRDKINVFQDKILEISTNKMKCLRSTICFIKIQRLIGCFSPPLVKTTAQLWETSQFLVKKYFEYSDIESVSKKGESRVVDELLLIAVEVLLQDLYYLRSEEDLSESGLEIEPENYPSFTPRIFYAQCLLTLAIEKSPHNATLKLTLMWLHSFNKNVMAVEKLYYSMEIKSNFIDKQSWIYFSLVSEHPLSLKKLEALCKLYKKYYKNGEHEILPLVAKGYAKQNIEEIKHLYIQKTLSSNSIYRVIIQHEQLLINLFRVLHYPAQGFARLLRDNLSLLTSSISLPSLKNYSIPADPCVIYECGVLKIKSLRDIKSKFPYEPKGVSDDPFRHRKHSPLECLGKYKNLKWIRIEALRLKLVLDVVERNSEDLEAELGIFHNELNGLGLLAKPALKKYAGLKPMNRDPGAIKEAVQQVRELHKANEAPFTGKFASDSEFIEHKKHMHNYFWKFQLMLFEGAFRLINAHSQNEEPGKEPREPEYEFTFLLTSYPHVIRHFEILNLMLKDMEGLLIPREDYLKNLKLGLSKINTSLDDDQKVEEEEEDLNCHPGMLDVITEFMTGPLVMSLMLNVSFAALAPTKQISPDDYSHVQNLKRIIQEFNVMLGNLLVNIKEYLEIQMRGCFYENLAKVYVGMKEIRATIQFLHHSNISANIENLMKNHLEQVKSMIDMAKYLAEIPRPAI